MSSASQKLKENREMKFVYFYCMDGTESYLDHVKAYRRAGYPQTMSPNLIAYHAKRLLNKLHIREKIKELLPSVAFNYLFIRNELLDMYNTAKARFDETGKDSFLKLQKDLLCEMAEIEGLYNKSVATNNDAVHTEAEAAEARKLWNMQVEKMAAKKEAEKIVNSSVNEAKVV